jgi:integrase
LTHLRAGGRLERLSRILGHSSVAVTEPYYAHVDPTDLAEHADLVIAVRRWEEAS